MSLDTKKKNSDVKNQILIKQLNCPRLLYLKLKLQTASDDDKF